MKAGPFNYLMRGGIKASLALTAGDAGARRRRFGCADEARRGIYALFTVLALFTAEPLAASAAPPPPPEIRAVMSVPGDALPMVGWSRSYGYAGDEENSPFFLAGATRLPAPSAGPLTVDFGQTLRVTYNHPVTVVAAAARNYTNYPFEFDLPFRQVSETEAEITAPATSSPANYVDVDVTWADGRYTGRQDEVMGIRLPASEVAGSLTRSSLRFTQLTAAPVRRIQIGRTARLKVTVPAHNATVGKLTYLTSQGSGPPVRRTMTLRRRRALGAGQYALGARDGTVARLSTRSAATMLDIIASEDMRNATVTLTGAGLRMLHTRTCAAQNLPVQLIGPAHRHETTARIASERLRAARLC